MALSLTLLDAVALLLAVLIIKRILANRYTHRRLPGPRPWPIIGNALDMPSSHEWKTFAKWGEQYGDIVSVRVLGKTYIILNSFKDAVELLDKRSSIYSDRPVIPFGGKMVGWERFLGLLRYGSTFREIRRLSSAFMGSRKAIERYHPIIESEANALVVRIADDPSKHLDHIRGFAGAIILKLSYGYKVQGGHDALVQLVDDAMANFSVSSAPGYLPNVFPILSSVPEWLPGGGWKRTAREWRACADRMAEEPMTWAKQQMSAGAVRPSFVSAYLDGDTTPEREALVKYAAGSLYGGGTDTTVSSIDTFFLAMLVNPDVMREAQEEIDAVIGTDRLPSLAARDQLPYVQALFLETVRWQPVAPLGAHSLMEDDVYEGYHLSRGSVVIANIWQMLHDPETYPDPFAFKPERFLAMPTHDIERDPRDIAFGFGRRICPGLHLADASVWLAIATSLAVFDIQKAIEHGQIVEPKIEYTTGTVSHPAPYKLTIKPRSSKAEALIRLTRKQHADTEF